MRFWKFLPVLAAALLAVTLAGVASASEAGIIEQIIAGEVFEGNAIQPTVYFTPNGAAVISVPGGSDELVDVEVDDDGTIAFVGSTRPEFIRLWWFDGDNNAIVSGDGRLKLAQKGVVRGAAPHPPGNGTPGCAPGHCH